MKSRPQKVLVPETVFDQRVMMAIERGKLADLLFDDPERFSHRALSRVMRARRGGHFGWLFTMRQRRTNPEAKEKLLEAAQRLMLAKGYSATSVDEICGAANLTKGSFFHYFGSKEDLGKAVLDRFMSSMFQVIRDSSFFNKKDPLQRVYGYIDFMIELSKDPERRNGCLLGNFAQVLSDTHPGIRELCAGHFNWWADTLKQQLDEVRSVHSIKKTIDTQRLAEHFIALFEGSLTLAKTRRDTGIVGRNLLHFKQQLKNLFKK